MTAAALTPPSAARSNLGSLARAVLIAASAAVIVLLIIHRREIWQWLVASVPGIAAVGWSMRRNVVGARALFVAWLAPSPLTKPNGDQPMIDFATIAGKVESWIQHLPPEIKTDAAQLAADLKIEGEKAVVGAVDAAIAKQAPTIEPAIAPYVQKAFDAAIALAEHELASLKAANAAVLPPAA